MLRCNQTFSVQLCSTFDRHCRSNKIQAINHEKEERRGKTKGVCTVAGRKPKTVDASEPRGVALDQSVRKGHGGRWHGVLQAPPVLITDESISQ